MTKLGAGDDIPANAVRNKKERDRYAVVSWPDPFLVKKIRFPGHSHVTNTQD